jgi:hypothetical protein
VLDSTPADVLDYERIRRPIKELNKYSQVCEIAIHHWRIRKTIVATVLLK